MDKYFSEIQRHFADNTSTEYTYRTAFENFLKEIFSNEKIQEIKHEKSTGEKNKPDFIVLENKVPNLYIECKDVPVDLNKVEESEQAARYFGYDNLIITNYVEFRFYRYGKPYQEPIHIGIIDTKGRQITTQFAEKIDLLKKAIVDFSTSHKEEIKYGEHLAKIMGGKAIRIRENIVEILKKEKNKDAEELKKLMRYLCQSLISDLDEESFSDMYAQTLVYGLFAARYNDKTPDTFSRTEARDLVPKTNPLLKDFFTHIALDRFPASLAIIVDELCAAFCHANIPKLLSDFYKKEKDEKDPIIHFYEDFLHEYDRKKKMEMGVFYTPQPVVEFIIRGTDELLKTEFGIDKGLANAEKIKVKIREKLTDDKEKKTEKEFHKVQILDIATGTGTFLNKVIEHISKSFVGQEGRWKSYVDENLIPRLHGFELMMASYTIAHLKLGITLQNLGIKEPKNRLGIYLTNTLEKIEKIAQQMSMFGVIETIAEENEEAGKIKNDLPIMCVIGNPPYSGESMNKNYADNDVYKVEIGGKEKIKERNPKWINDDYVKFIRYAESLIEKNENGGIMSMITAHGYIDNPTFRGMRWHLRKTFDKIYVLDLHGNSRKKETAPDGSPDQNVFDIMTGVSIILGVKKATKAPKKLAQVFVADFWGKRKEKFAKLSENSIASLKWQELPAETDIWRLEGKGKKEYQKGFSVVDIFPKNSVGVVTAKDRVLIACTKKELEKQINEFYGENMYDDKFREKISYRPFDYQEVYFDTQKIERSREKIMQHFLKGENVGLCFQRGSGCAGELVTPQLSKSIYDQGYCYPATSALTYGASLYLYKDQNEKIPNLNKEIWGKINAVTGETAPENILDYIYAVLHSPKYREKFAEFLKTDFPRVPYPTDKKEFFRLVKSGEKLRKLHLMEDPSVEELITTFPESGDCVVEKVKYLDGKIWINAVQYFGNVPEEAWNFYIGGYQPAQKWLKDRKGRTLSSDDILHYQKIVKVLAETDKIMKEVDKNMSV